jgi:hypothetical protein
MATDAPTKRMIHAAKLVAVTISFTYVVESLCLLRYRDRQDRQNHVWPQQERPRDERAPLDKKGKGKAGGVVGDLSLLGDLSLVWSEFKTAAHHAVECLIHVLVERFKAALLGGLISS